MRRPGLRRRPRRAPRGAPSGRRAVRCGALREELGVERDGVLVLLGHIRLRVDRVDRAGLHARVAVDALDGIDVQLLGRLEVRVAGLGVDAVHRTHLDARVVLDATADDHVRHGRRGYCIAPCPPPFTRTCMGYDRRAQSGSAPLTGRNGMRGIRGASRLALAAGLLVAAAGLTACGSSSSSSSSASTDPGGAALSSAGVRVVLVPRQKNDLTIVVPPCSEAQTVQSGTTKLPPGSNQVLIPRGSLTEAVGVQACQQGGQSIGFSTGGASGNVAPPPSNTILVTPGGAGAQEVGAQGGSSSSGSQAQNQVVLPSNANVSTVIVPPCTTTSSSSGSSQPSQKTLSLPSGSKSKIVAAPPCTAPAGSSSSS